MSASLVGARELRVEPIRWGRLLLKNPETGAPETAVDVVTDAGLSEYAASVRAAMKEISAQVMAQPQLATDPNFGILEILGRLTGESRQP